MLCCAFCLLLFPACGIVLQKYSYDVEQGLEIRVGGFGVALDDQGEGGYSIRQSSLLQHRQQPLAFLVLLEKLVELRLLAKLA